MTNPPNVTTTSTIVVHANFTGGALRIWAESAERAATCAVRDRDGNAAEAAPQAGSNRGSVAAPRGEEHHPFAASAAELSDALADAGIEGVEPSAERRMMKLWLPGSTRGPWPSRRLEALLAADEPEDDPIPVAVVVESIAIAPARIAAFLRSVEDWSGDGSIQFGHAFRFWIAAIRFALDLLEDQRVVPTLVQRRGGPLQGAWHPWLRDTGTAARMAALVAAMPGIARAATDEHEHDAALILEDLLGTVIDAVVREMLLRETYSDALDGRDAAGDPHVAWLHGLLDESDDVPAAPGEDVTLLRGARQWLATLDDTGEGLPYRLLLRLNEPELAPDEDSREARWWLSLHLVAPEDPTDIIDAGSLWARGAAGRGAPGGERASELLLKELGRASRLFARLEGALAEAAPTGLFLSTKEAYAFLREHRGVLVDAGFHVEVPPWWDQPQSRLAARLLIESAEEAPEPGVNGADSRHGLQNLVRYRWQIALGDRPMTIDQFRALADRGVPLVRVGDRWVEIREQDLVGAMRFLEEHPGGETTVLEAMRLAYGAAADSEALPIAGLEATGWVGKVFGPDADAARLESIEQPRAFLGSLRPYQLAGLSWMAFLDRFGLGACLADDMGLGKTIQLIALLQHERRDGTDPGGPTLLVAPMSVLANWERETNRFAPELKVHVHHGLERPLGDDFVRIASGSDLVVTTYALVTRDRETLERVLWRRICLDEAQHIKNPPTKQTAAIRSLPARHRVALTGTPVENRLSELWSIMEFCNPGYLGTTGDFRRSFAMPIERHRDRRQAERLRRLVRPFILRRVKTDPDVIADLPPLVETKHAVPLTVEQTALYERIVAEMLARVDRAEGIQRRGLVLAALVKLKQICNHPANYLKESLSDPATAAGIVSERSGKSIRLLEMVEELLAAGDKALVFTQYREMGHILVSMIRRHLDTESLFLHGGTPAARRQQLIDRFQDPEGGAPIFVLSLKAGGVGLNLTAANHVFHYDRWWNPAVENQATDRAFRIGQRRTVHVHKLISAGTLEERIDQMIEQKTELASQIIGSGESWLTELSTGQLRDLFALRHETLASDDLDAEAIAARRARTISIRPPSDDAVLSDEELAELDGLGAVDPAEELR
ncbi:MAG TPA: DEAD/DEAH box helicase [Phycisphaerales bacterium]|nr:DEAD/DEAH box helicase [Phycisphaerales bacterium]HMP36183.1 DEAD/DEAH box helicase [Phycisphaerales bacterium]